MQTEVIMAGFGGQGVMLIGQLLSYSALAEGKETCWIPSYGPEMRGGTANCTIVISDIPIGSPIIYSPQACIVMNRQSLEKFGPKVKSGGILLINSSLIDISSDRTDITAYRIPANDLAMEMGNGKAANMVLLGVLIGLTQIVKLTTVCAQIEDKFRHKREFVELNLRVIRRGYEIGVASLKEVKP